MSLSINKNQKIVFVDKKTLQLAGLSQSATGFFIGQDGNVYEFIEQGFANYYCMSSRSDVTWDIINT